MNKSPFLVLSKDTKFLKLASDILKISALESPQYADFLLKQEKYLDLRDVEFSGVGFFLNFNKPKYIDETIKTRYIPSDPELTKTLKFNTIKEDFDFIVFCSEGYIDFIEIVTPYDLDSWDGKFDTYNFS